MEKIIHESKKVRMIEENGIVRVFMNGTYVLSIDTNSDYETLPPQVTIFKELKKRKLHANNSMYLSQMLVFSP